MATAPFSGIELSNDSDPRDRPEFWAPAERRARGSSQKQWLSDLRDPATA